MLARCPYCNSIWVCWNWIQSDIETAVELNPNIPRTELEKSLIGHECWSCGDDWGGSCWCTPDLVTNGVPYWVLRYIHGLPDIIWLFFYRLFHRR